MTPSRWLFLTGAATAAATSMLAAETHPVVRGFAVLLPLLLVRQWRAGLRGVFVVICIFAGLGLRVHLAPTVLPVPPQVRVIEEVRQGFLDRLIAAMPERQARLGAGMLLGDVSEPAPDLVKTFRRAGINHLLAVSGGNLAVVLTFISVVAAARRSRTANVITVLAVAPAFCLLTNAEPSILRASVMAMTVAIVRRCGRSAQPVNALVAAGTVLLWVWPGLLWQSVGFQLSLSATFGLVAFGAPLEVALARRLPKAVASVAGATLGATFATTPVALLTFGQVSLVGPFTNLVVVPLVPVVMALIGLVAGTSLLLPPVAPVVGVSAWAVLLVIEKVTATAAHLPAASVLLSPLVGTAAALALAIFLGYIFRRHVRVAFS